MDFAIQLVSKIPLGRLSLELQLQNVVWVLIIVTYENVPK